MQQVDWDRTACSQPSSSSERHRNPDERSADARQPAREWGGEGTMDARNWTSIKGHAGQWWS
jgi:hypothetical protein